MIYSLKPEKCFCEKNCIEYLGMIISHGHIEMDPVNWSNKVVKTCQGQASASISWICQAC